MVSFMLTDVTSTKTYVLALVLFNVWAHDE